MIDLHCHFLPFVDDGARNWEESLDLARAAVDNGIKHAVLTPHIYPGRWDNSLTTLMPIFEEFRSRLQSSDIPLQISLGAEMHLMAESISLLEDGLVPFVGTWLGESVLLIELHDGRIPVGTLRAINYLLDKNFVPMIAHPERNKEVMSDASTLYPLVQSGCLIQVTAGSIIGRFGKRVQRTVRRLLDENWVSVVATDSHNLRHRPPLLREAHVAIEVKYGSKLANELFVTNPEHLLGLDPLHVTDYPV